MSTCQVAITSRNCYLNTNSILSFDVGEYLKFLSQEYETLLVELIRNYS